MQNYDVVRWGEEAKVNPVADLVTRASDAYSSSQAGLVGELGMKPPATLRKIARELARKSDELRSLSPKIESVRRTFTAVVRTRAKASGADL